MKHFSREIIDGLPSRFKANLVNSCTGYKSSNLLATKSKSGVSNIAIFNSVIHIGSNPPMLGFVLRPLTVRRNTYDNFKNTGYFTVNQVNTSILKDAHHTSAKYDAGVSEFSKTNLTEEYLDEFTAPYVKESNIKIGCSYLNEYEIKENGCLLIIGAIEHIYLPENMQHEDGWAQLDKAGTITAIGLDGYALPKLVDRFAYAKPDQETKSILNGA
ncbi:flavin reductase family protein [Costertonia aggregata]|uniref:Flavin reductase n=1 Tax=Costertonia aggregata TaxID=343403 RepID=A0A7H9ALG3_9FLAO|nr:flavin reductase [Costertonia aggregata]QLG44306.1 flavin reductase [Costertonia aggregata]